jgi:hypothetical protein
MTSKELDKLSLALCVIIDRLEDTVKSSILEQLKEVNDAIYSESLKQELKELT